MDKIQFITVPNQPWTQDPNRLELAPGSDALWRKIRFDQPLGRLGADAVSPGNDQPGKQPEESASASPSPSSSPSASPSSTPNQQAQEAARKESAREAGLCA